MDGFEALFLNVWIKVAKTNTGLSRSEPPSRGNGLCPTPSFLRDHRTSFGTPDVEVGRTAEANYLYHDLATLHSSIRICKKIDKIRYDKTRSD